MPRTAWAAIIPGAMMPALALAQVDNDQLGGWYAWQWTVNRSGSTVGFQGDMQHRNRDIAGDMEQLLARGGGARVASSRTVSGSNSATCRTRISARGCAISLAITVRSTPIRLAAVRYTSRSVAWFDRNRASAGLGYGVSATSRVQVSYMHQRLEESGKGQIQLNWIQTF